MLRCRWLPTFRTTVLQQATLFSEGSVKMDFYYTLILTVITTINLNYYSLSTETVQLLTSVLYWLHFTLFSLSLKPHRRTAGTAGPAALHYWSHYALSHCFCLLHPICMHWHAEALTCSLRPLCHPQPEFCY
jgi:hypothetical protein